MLAVLGAGLAVACGLSVQGRAADDPAEGGSPDGPDTLLEATNGDTNAEGGNADADVPPDADIDAPIIDPDGAAFDVQAYDVLNDVAPEACPGVLCGVACVLGQRCPCLGSSNCQTGNEVCILGACHACGDLGTQNYACKGGGKCHETKGTCK